MNHVGQGMQARLHAIRWRRFSSLGQRLELAWICVPFAWACATARPDSPNPHHLESSRVADRTSGPAAREPTNDSAPCTPTASNCVARAEALSSDDTVGAEALLVRCLECTDVPPVAHRLLSALRVERGATELARDALLAGVRRHPNSVLLWRALGRLELSMSRHREGLSAIATAHRLQPDDVELEDEYRRLVAAHGTDEDRLEAEIHPLLLEAIGRWEINDERGAIGVLEIALEKAAKVPRLRALVRHRLAIIHIAKGRPKEALAHLGAGLEKLDRKSVLRAELLVSRSEALLSLRRIAEAERAAEEAIRIDPTNPLAHANRAIARSLDGDSDAAVREFALAFDRGLSRRLTLAQFLALGPALERLHTRSDFVALVRRAYPTSQYPNPPTTRAKP